MHKQNRPIFLGTLFIHNLFADRVVFFARDIYEQVGPS